MCRPAFRSRECARPPRRGWRQGLAGLLWAFIAALPVLPAGAATASAAVPAALPSEIRIGVLSVLNDEDAQRQWQPLVEGLAHALGGARVRLQALAPTALESAVARGALDFAVTNPGHYVVLEARHGAARIATQSAGAGGDPAHAVGSAVVVRADAPQQPATLAALRGRRVAAVAEDAFGGYQLAAAEWLRQGLDAEAGGLRRVFTGYPMQRVAQAVLSGEADAGVLRTCLLEQWVQAGQVPAGVLRVVPAPTQGTAVPASCQASTPLYPGWAFAALAGTPPELSRTVLLALLALPADALGGRWSVPADYQRVHDALRALQVEPYAFLRETRLQALLRRYWLAAAAVLALLLAGAAYLLRVEVLVKRRTAELTRSLRERERMAAQVAQSQEAVHHLARLSILGELAATLAHELNHPLATIANYAAGLRRRAARGVLAPQALDEALGAMADETERAARVIGGVRALARKRAAVRQRLDAVAVARDTVALFQGLLAQAPPVAVTVAPGAEALRAFGDAQQIQQVLLNLLQNALDAHRAAGRALAPIALHIGVEDGCLALAVQDQGAPLAPEALARLFEPFHTTKPDGLGLGLSISRGIAEAHGGALHARPVPPHEGGGLRMVLLLPLAAAPAPGATAIQTVPIQEFAT